jgi:hypothetical protein
MSYLLIGLAAWFAAALGIAWGWSRFHRALEHRGSYGLEDWQREQRQRVDLLP